MKILRKGENKMTDFKNLKPYANRSIEDWGSVVSKDYKSFQTKYRNFLKKVCANNGYELVKFSPNHYEFSCFIKGDDKYVYVSISDVRYFKNSWYKNILIRSAKSDTDYTGGPNNYVDLPNLEAKLKRMLA